MVSRQNSKFTTCRKSQLSNQISTKQIKILNTRIKIMQLKAKLGNIKRIDLMDAIIELNKKKLSLVSYILDFLNKTSDMELLLGVEIDKLGFIKIKI